MSRPVALLLALALPLGAAAAEVFDDGRLFTTPKQRERLDRARAGVRVETPDAGRAPALSEPEPAESPPEVRLRGFVRRSGGPTAVWVNDSSTLGGGGLGGDLEVEGGRVEGSTVVIRLPDGRQIRLKPGQRWDPQSGRVTDAYGR